MNQKDCTAYAILHYQNDYPACIVRMYPAQSAVTVRWHGQKRSKTIKLPNDLNLRGWILSYARENETSPEFFAVNRPSTDITYRIYERKLNGEIDWSFNYADHNYSTLEEANDEVRAISLRPSTSRVTRFVIVKVTITKEVIE